LPGTIPSVKYSPQSLLTLFFEFKPRVVNEPLTDFSGIKRSAAPFCQVAPRSLQEVFEIVGLAAQENVPLRVRGMGHALNGSSLPKPGELTVCTAHLNWVRYEEEGTVTAGGGIGLWPLRDLVRGAHFTLPVINDGYAGPSVGGFVAAGGFGPGSAEFGGFWENVAEISLATASGLKRIKRQDELFPWLFGSMGQLGIVVEARLDLIVHHTDESPAYPKGTSIPIPVIEEVSRRALAVPPEEAGMRLYWFTLFVAEQCLPEALAHLTSLESKHIGVFRYRERYCYLIRHRNRVVAPLIYRNASAFFAVGAWGFHEDNTPAGLGRLNAFEEDFMHLALKYGFHRYIQSELVDGPQTYLRYFNPGIFSQLQVLKQSLDPQSLFNRSWMFSAD
jgi:FAD/FMN-containing dehydrogenase